MEFRNIIFRHVSLSVFSVVDLVPIPMIEIKDLHKSFGRKQILRGLSLSVDTGESMVVIGGSGSGKSVLIKHLVRLLRPDAGEIWLDGERITSFLMSIGRNWFGTADTAGANAVEPPIISLPWVGWSMGVQVVLALYERRPEVVSHLVFINGTYGKPLDTTGMPCAKASKITRPYDSWSEDSTSA